MTSAKKQVRLSDIIGPAFYETHRLINMGIIDEAVEAGGRASLKSSYVSVELVQQLLKHPDCHALVTRQVGDTMRDSVYAQILWAIDKLGLTTKFRCTQSPLQCTYLPTGQRILFRGLDDPQKIKSIKLPFGYIGILWFEEADQIKGGEEAVRNVQQSALRGGEFLRALLGAGIDGDELKILDQTPGRDEFFYNRAGTDDGKFHSESPSFLALQRRMNHCQMGSIPSSSRRSGCHWVASTRSPYS